MNYGLFYSSCYSLHQPWFHLCLSHQTLQLELLLWLLSPFIRQSIKFYCSKNTTKPVKKGSLAVCSPISPTSCTGQMMVKEPAGDKEAIWVREDEKDIRIKKGRNSASYHGCTTLGIFSSRWEYMMLSCYKNGLWGMQEVCPSACCHDCKELSWGFPLWSSFASPFQIPDRTSGKRPLHPWTSLGTRGSQHKICLNLCSGDTQMWSPGASLTTVVITIHYFPKVYNWLVFLFWLLWRIQGQISTGC